MELLQTKRLNVNRNLECRQHAPHCFTVGGAPTDGSNTVVGLWPVLTKSIRYAKLSA
jgi:hypothetical protein